MDPFQKLFKKYWPAQSLNPSSRKSKKSNTEVGLEEFQKSLEFFAQALFFDSWREAEPSNQTQSIQNIQLRPSLGFVGLRGIYIFLPPRIDFFETQEQNRELYLNLILQIFGAHRLGCVAALGSKGLQLIDHLAFLEKIPQINAELDRVFPCYPEFQKKLFEALLTRPRNPPGFIASKIGIASGATDSATLFDLWRQIYQLRSPGLSGKREGLGNLVGLDRQRWPTRWNRSHPDWDFLRLTTPSLELRSSEWRLGSEAPRTPGPREPKELKTEIEKPTSSETELIDLEKEKGSPVTHSFEKLDTADEYQGGYKFDSGDDELQDHSQALEELDLTKVTRGGEAAQSIYRSESFDLFGTPIEEPLALRGKAILYPEWSYRKATYMGDHCQLFENPLGACPEPRSPSLPGEGLREKLEKEYGYQLGDWRKRIQSLVNRPLWIRRLKEGDEIDCDAYVRDFPALNRGQEVEGRWYSRKRKRLQDLSILILFDQSLSTDSWVLNRRVLDVILDSVGLLGILFEDNLTSIQVAGTWSATRHDCGFQFYKRGKASWDSFFGWSAHIVPQGYTRLGPAIRHGVEVLSAEHSEKKLLLLLTDGKPTDLDGYEGHQGIYDVKQACLEAEARGIHPLALTIDQESKHHFPKMFNHYKLLQNPQDLFEELYQVFLRLLAQGSS